MDASMRPEDITIAEDDSYLARTLTLAQRGWGQTAPNPMVGAVVVSNGKIIGEGYHASYGDPHAEVVALRAAGDRSKGATLYVSLEPCNHTGKTPPCSRLIVESGISRLVYASRDPNPLAEGGAETLVNAGIQVDYRPLQEAQELNAAFFASFSYKRPWITVKLGVTIDGAIADSKGASKWITNELSREQVQRMRGQVDGIAVGAGTYLADIPSLIPRIEPPPRLRPRRIVFDHGGKRLGLSDTTRNLPDDFLVMTDADIVDSLRSLKSHYGINSLLVEGGAGLVGELFKANVVDRLVIFQAPIILGNRSLNGFGSIPSRAINNIARYRVIERRTFRDDLMTVYAIK